MRVGQTSKSPQAQLEQTPSHPSRASQGTETSNPCCPANTHYSPLDNNETRREATSAFIPAFRRRHNDICPSNVLDEAHQKLRFVSRSSNCGALCEPCSSHPIEHMITNQCLESSLLNGFQTLVPGKSIATARIPADLRASSVDVLCCEGSNLLVQVSEEKAAPCSSKTVALPNQTPKSVRLCTLTGS